MQDLPKLLYEATRRGYVVQRPSVPLLSKTFHTWCVTQKRPYVYVDLRRTDKYKGAVVAIDLFTTTNDEPGGDRFTPAVLAEARHLLASYPSVNRAMPLNLPRISPLSIRQAGVPIERAEELAQALLALYRRMKAVDAS